MTKPLTTYHNFLPSDLGLEVKLTKALSLALTFQSEELFIVALNIRNNMVTAGELFDLSDNSGYKFRTVLW